MTVYTSLIVPTVTSHATGQTLQWTADGQLCLNTKASVYIMTPDHGISFDTDSIIRPSINIQDKDAGNTIGWFRTMIQFDKLVPFKWPEYSQGWGTLSLGLMDLTLHAVALSPSGLSSEAGCVAATLSSNMDLCLWAPVKNFLKGEWKMIFEVTPLLLEKLLPTDAQEPEDKVVIVLKAQIVSIAWSQLCDFGYKPSLTINGSLLIAGNRAGSLIFLRFSRESQGIELVDELGVSNTWVIHVALISWNTSEQGQCISYLAYGDADGSIGVVRLTQQLSQKRSRPSPEPLEFVENEIALMTEKLSPLVHEPDEVGITALQWLNLSDDNKVLAHCTPGFVHLHYPSVPVFSSSTSTLNWATHSFRLKTHYISIASSALHPPSGITYLQAHDSLIVTLSDGSINILRGLRTGNPHLTEHDKTSYVSEEESESQVVSKSLSMNARSIFVQCERGEVDGHDMNKITGMTGYDPDNGVFAWSYEVHRPGDFSYKHDAKQKAVLVVANLRKQGDLNGGDVLLRKLQTILEGIKAASGQAPLNILRPVLFSLRDGKKLNAVHGEVLDILSGDVPRSDEIVAFFGSESIWSKWKGKSRARTGQIVQASVRKWFRQNVARHLLGWDAVTTWRLRLSLADHIWNLSDSPERIAACGAVAQNLLAEIMRHVFRTLMKHVLAVSPFLTLADVPFAYRLSLVVQTLLGSTLPPDLVDDAQELLDAVKDMKEEGPLGESCPACGIEVPLTDIRGAVCGNGHVWTRCSVTTFILSTAFVRTCVGCKRKAFLAPSSPVSMNGDDEERLKYLPTIAKGWLVEELLEATERCLFCENALVCIV